MQRLSRDFGEERLREFWESGFTVSEYSGLIGQSGWTVQPKNESSMIDLS